MEKRRRWQKHNVPGLLILFSVIFTFYSICDDGFAENSNFNAFHLAIYLWPNEPVRCVYMCKMMVEMVVVAPALNQK